MTSSFDADDRAQVMDLLARYSWAVDLKSAARVAELFVEDGLLKSRGREYRGRNGVMSMQQLLDTLPVDQHLLSNVVMLPQSAREVRVHSCVTCTRSGDADWKVGYYVDEVVKIDVDWLFSRRLFRWWNEEPPPPDLMERPWDLL